MYFLLDDAKERFHDLSHGLGGILIFVGIKMAVSHWVHMNTYLSLVIIVAMLGSAIALSVERRTEPTGTRCRECEATVEQAREVVGDTVGVSSLSR